MQWLSFKAVTAWEYGGTHSGTSTSVASIPYPSLTAGYRGIFRVAELTTPADTDTDKNTRWKGALLSGEPRPFLCVASVHYDVKSTRAHGASQEAKLKIIGPMWGVFTIHENMDYLGALDTPDSYTDVTLPTASDEAEDEAPFPTDTPDYNQSFLYYSKHTYLCFWPHKRYADLSWPNYGAVASVGSTGLQA